MKLCVVAGEASGDLHASEVVRELKELDSALQTFGFGGDLLAAEGTRILHHVSELGIVGLFNVLRHLSMFRRIFGELVSAIEAERPDAVLLVDYPDFNLRLARRVRAMGIPVIYYISPQVWAWRKGRVADIARQVDEMIVILPFEEPFYRQRGVRVSYVGHPLVEQLGPLARDDRSAPDGTRPARIALMPGSRRHEVASLLPAMLDAVRELRRDAPIESFVIQAPTISDREIDTIVAASGVAIEIVRDEQRRALASADLSLSSSGTATLEAAILGVPVIVMYRLTPATYVLARWLVRLPHISLVNIIAGREIVPELLQNQVTGPAIAREARRLLQPDVHASVREDLRQVKAKLGTAGASKRAAARIFAAVHETRAGAPRDATAARQG